MITPNEARLILRDGGFQGLVECSSPEEWPELVKVHSALKKLEKELRRIAKRKKK